MIMPDRLQAAMTRRGLNQSELARRVGVSAQMINKLARGSARDTARIYDIAKALDVSPEYLAGEGDDLAPVGTTDHRIPFRHAPLDRQPDIVLVRQIDLSFGMGATYLDVPVTEVECGFSRDFLSAYSRSSPDQLLFARGVGDSMNPTIHDSDLLLIDCSQRTVRMAEMIWAVAYGGCGSIKRLRPMADGGIKMIADNPLVPDEIAYDGELQVLGRVVAVVRKV